MVLRRVLVSQSQPSLLRRLDGRLLFFVRRTSGPRVDARGVRGPSGGRNPLALRERGTIISPLETPVVLVLWDVTMQCQASPRHHGYPLGRRFPRRGDRTVRKAERQRLKAERRQLRAEVKEIKKKLRVEKRSLQWSGPAAPARPALPHMASASTQAPGPGLSVSSLVPTMAALFLDENLPDGTRLEPGAKFIKYWKMRNSGTIGWTSETKLKFMWGNLGLASEERRELPVPPLQPGQVGVVSVAFVAPVMDGTYTSHWRLAHCGTQFGPRVWCSIVVDPGNTGHTFCPQSNRLKEDRKEDSALDSETEMSVDLSNRDYYFPSVDLLTAQDLLSFELLDINIVQELETVPNNTPVDLTPCMSPLPRDTPVMERAAPVAEGPGADLKSCFSVKPGARAEAPGPEDEREQEISGAQFLCETLIRSLTLEEAPDQKPPRRGPQAPRRPLGKTREGELGVLTEERTDAEEKSEEDEEEEEEEDSQTSSCDDYIIVLPDCFDTTRPLGDSTYTPTQEDQGPPQEGPEGGQEGGQEGQEEEEEHASKTLKTPPLTPPLVTTPSPPPPTPAPPPQLPATAPVPVAPPTLYSPSRAQGGITEGLVKGALSVAASAYKALFTGPNCSVQVSPTPSRDQDPSLMAMLLEMGFRDLQLNQRLLRKHGYSLLHTVNELVQIDNSKDLYI
uniref:NBR1 autophagy cargo receptor a n=1 Tax=Gadus morhua TaxID=8049 RepID=A0A8C4YZU3_GADMO